MIDRQRIEDAYAAVAALEAEAKRLAALRKLTADAGVEDIFAVAYASVSGALLDAQLHLESVLRRAREDGVRPGVETLRFRKPA